MHRSEASYSHVLTRATADLMPYSDCGTISHALQLWHGVDDIEIRDDQPRFTLWEARASTFYQRTAQTQKVDMGRTSVQRGRRHLPARPNLVGA